MCQFVGGLSLATETVVVRGNIFVSEAYGTIYACSVYISKYSVWLGDKRFRGSVTIFFFEKPSLVIFIFLFREGEIFLMIYFRSCYNPIDLKKIS